jgi:hypothetical protein
MAHEDIGVIVISLFFFFVGWFSLGYFANSMEEHIGLLSR